VASIFISTRTRKSCSLQMAQDRMLTRFNPYTLGKT
jgi:hypothetical protein